MFATVAPLINIPKLLTYKIPEQFRNSLKIGTLVFVPIKNRYYPAFTIKISPLLQDSLKEEEILEIYNIPPLPVFFDEAKLNFYMFAASYYNTPLGVVLKSVVPNLDGFQIKDVVTINDKETSLSDIKKRFPNITLKELKKLEDEGVIERSVEIILKNKNTKSLNYLDIEEDKEVLLTEKQQEVKNSVVSSLNSGITHLLFGKTGSGKTELLLDIAKDVMQKGFNVLYLVPEISLVPHIYKRASSMIAKDKILVWHSSISKNIRWHSLLKMIEKNILLIGTRSSIFLPLNNVKLIVVDEEHDASYKNDGQFCYNARDMAIMHAKMLSHPVILSSATPSVETYYNANKGKYHLHKLEGRFSPRKLDVVVVNTKETEMIEGFFSKTLVEFLKENLRKNLQSMIFINRRGYIPYIYCEACKRFIQCEDCTVPLTWHRKKNLLSCHRCGRTYKAINLCPYCNNPQLAFFGAGTERIKELLTNLFPDANILKIDRDDTEKANFFRKHLTSILDGSYNIVVATQIMAKGHHMPNLTLVGVLLGEQGLSIPDFRAQERSFQILTQVFGRAGREKEGKVVIHTSLSDAPPIKFAIDDNYDDFYNYEISSRQEAGFPPFVRILLIKIASKIEQKAKETAEEIFKTIGFYSSKSVICYPPQPAYIYREKGRFHYQIYVKAKNHKTLVELVKKLQSGRPKQVGLSVSFDIDPYNMM